MAAAIFAASSSSSSSYSLLLASPTNSKSLSRSRFIVKKSTGSVRLIRNRRSSTRRIAAINDIAAAADSGQVGVTWQIVVGVIAGVTPFVVAGIEFSKRIIAQRRCEVCGGSGLVLRENDYFRCPGCGGFLPWQSWKRFFSG
ncbi:hypothetical protein P3X46_027267 [Hevea brasiliensis]|uniref:Viral late gene transcription factor 3 zinc ribbon domain-containing protein n=1 Tax=Hevea brasiliensis TaxID=3981 RepID=A0ABQ9KZB6_HEVBR|nr:uncharacterized protein LOC110633647 isoform X2 [Hevea brasiliensis]KAJ9153878.1 hypothetical protein P3X46_027267 [Hevea brasiliensis]